jgi:hypothetical protein
VVGLTSSGDFPVTPGAAQPSLGGDFDAFIARIASADGQLVFGTYTGGSGREFGLTAAFDREGGVIMGGFTTSPDLEVSPDAFQTQLSGGWDGILFRFSSSGEPMASTLLGGAGAEVAGGLKQAESGFVLVTGWVGSSDFPVTPDAFQGTRPGTSAAYLTEIRFDLRALVYSTYIGGSADDRADSLALDGLGRVHLMCTTVSNDFPVTPGAFQTTNMGNPYDAAIASARVVGVFADGFESGDSSAWSPSSP